MDETQIHHLSTSHIEPTLLGYLKMHIIFPKFSKSCASNQLISEHIHGHSQNMWRIYLDLMHIFQPIPRKSFQSAFIHSCHLHHEIIDFLKIFSRKLHSQEIDFSRNSKDFSKSVFQRQVSPQFSLENDIFLRDSKEFSNLSPRSKIDFQVFQKVKFPGFRFPKFWISFSNEFSYKSSIIFLRKLSKSKFS